MAKQEVQVQPALEAESHKTVEKALVTKETIDSKRTEEAADRLAQKMKESKSYVENRFGTKSPTFKEKAESLFSKMMEKVQEVKDRIKATSEMVKGRSQKGAETGTKTEQALADLQKNLELKSPDEQKASLTRGIELVVAVQAMQKNGEAPQRTESSLGETERELLEEKIPLTMRIPVSGQVTFKRAGYFKNEKQEFFSDKDLEKNKGNMREEGGVIVFVDRSGKAWVTGNSPENKKALHDAHYMVDGTMNVPFSRGEEASEHFTDPTGEDYNTKLKRIKDIARARNEEAYAAERQKIEKKAA